MGKILVFIFEGMTDYEITLITHLLGADANKEIVTIGYENNPIKSTSGLMYKPSKTVNEVLSEEVEGLIIPGGWFGETRAEIITLINNLHSKGKLISAICGAGTIFLAKSGVLKDVKYTTPVEEWTDKHKEVFGELDPFPRENYVKERVVRDKNIITAQGIAFVDFAIETCDWFNLFESQEEKECFWKMFKGE
ncbi:MAG: DJ-1/PfpI family protein [Clostridium sp.]